MRIPRPVEFLTWRMAWLVLMPLAIMTIGFIRGGLTVPWGRGTTRGDVNATSNNSTARSAVRVLAVSQDGAYLDVGRGDGDFVRRDALTGRKLHALQVPRKNPPWLLFCGREEVWVGVNLHGQLEFVRDGAPRWQGPLPGQEPNEILVSCGISLDGGLIATVSASGSVWVLDFDEEQAVPRGRSLVGEPLTDAILSPTGDLLMLVTDHWQFLLWDIAQGKIVTRLEAEGKLAEFASWSGDGRRIITYGYDPQLLVWNVPSGECVQRLSQEDKVVPTAELSSDGRLAAVGDGDVIRLWDLDTGEELPSLCGHRGVISVLRFVDQDRTLFSGDTKGGVHRWSLTDYREIWSVP